jgi:methionyl-tRNA formyltransferase
MALSNRLIMTKRLNKIIFFGSGPVAARSLSHLAKNFDIEAVVTKPTTADDMKSLVNNKKVFSVTNKHELDKLVQAQNFKSKLGVVVDFGIIISPYVIRSFDKGIVNSHFSLLPEWRGADPITFAILSGQSKTGVSLMLINENLDEGDLLAQEDILIEKDITTSQLTSELIKLSNEMLINYLPKYISGEIEPYTQDPDKAITYSRKLNKKDGIIDWNKSAEDIEREIRAFHEWPKSRTNLNGIEVIILKAHAVPSKIGKPGEVDISGKASLKVACGQGHLSIDQIQPVGKKPMDVSSFLAGYRSRLK